MLIFIILTCFRFGFGQLHKMAQNFTNEEKLDMLVTYIKNHKNADRAANNYLEDYPDRQQPNKRYFSKIIINLLEFGAFQKPILRYHRFNYQ
jgi:hypothetical protein